MKFITRIFPVFLAMGFTLSGLQAQNTLMTKARTLGLKTSGVHNQVLPKSQTNNFRTTLLEEGFDGTWLPDGWTVINTNPTNNWEQGNVQDHDFNTIDPTSLYSAICPWINEDQDEWLISPEIDAGGETPLNLQWYAGVSGPWLDPGATLRCLISTDDGATWTELWNAIGTIDPAADWAWNEVNINLDDYAGTPFKLAWNYVGNDGDIVGVDGVMVHAGYNYLYQTNFEDYYTAGDMVALNDTTGFWTTWSNLPGSSEDAPVVNTQSSSAPNSAEDMGSTDLILKLGNKTSGKYMVNFKYYIVDGNGGYVNFQHFEEPGIEWAFEVYFGATGDGYMHAGMQYAANFTYAHDTWLQLSTVVDLDQDSAWFYIDDNLIYNWPWHYQADDSTSGTKQLGGVDFYAGAPTGETAHYYFDDVEYIELAAGVVSPILDIDSSSIVVLIGQWDQDTETFAMGNVGQEDLNYQIVTTYPQATKALNKIPAGIHPMIPKNLNNQYMIDPDPQPAVKNPSTRDVMLNYDGDNSSAIGNNNGDYEWRVAAMFPSDMVAPYVGMEIYKVDVYINDPPIATKLQIYGMGSYITGQPGALLMQQDFTAVPTSWNTIILDNPIYIDGSDIWVGYWLQGTMATFVPGVDAGPADPNGDWMAAGPGWSHLSDNPDLNFNWNIRAYLQGDATPQWLSTDPTEGTLAQDETTNVDVMIDASNLEPPNAYNGRLIVRNNDPDNPSVSIDVEADVIVGIDENGDPTKEYVAAYPNPVNDILNVSSDGNIQHIRIMNTVGQVVFDSAMDTHKAQINTSNYESGIYLLRVETKYGTSTQKIVVR